MALNYVMCSYSSVYFLQAEKLDLNPLYFMFPGVLATSYAFMLPVATPPNAIAFSYGRITVLDMVCSDSLPICFSLVINYSLLHNSV